LPGKKDDSPSRQLFDDQVEKTLISNLLNEKKDLESELQDMMQMRTMHALNESDLNVEGRVREQQRRMQAVDNLRSNIGDVLTRFQDEFLEFINRNYQKFTENDVLDLFSELRGKLDELMETISDVPIYFNGSVKNAL